MNINHATFIDTIDGPLAGFFLMCAAVNVLAAAIGAARRRWAWLGWLAAAGVFLLLAIMSLAGRPWLLPGGFKQVVNEVFTPVSFTLGSIAAVAAVFYWRRLFVRPTVAFGLLNVALLALGLSATDRHFAPLIAAPDHIAIVGLVFSLGFFLWAAAWQAEHNDQRLARGEVPDEAAFDGKALTWPDLVYIELIAMVLVTAGLLVWSVLLKAPLEEPANPVLTPNPSKAPWYFLGLQEMLVYADAWYAGVVVPVLMVIGLMAIPYIDPNRKGNGYYTIRERPFAIGVFLAAVVVLWLMPILVGTFMRGPNWTFFAPFEARDPYAIVPHEARSLSEYVWTVWLGTGMPEVSAEAGWWGRTLTILWRELLGIVLVAAYFVGLPWLLAVTWLKRMRQQMCRTQYAVMMVILLVMLSLPLKMLLRWTVDLSYVVAIPEWALSL